MRTSSTTAINANMPMAVLEKDFSFFNSLSSLLYSSSIYSSARASSAPSSRAASSVWGDAALMPCCL